MPNQHTVTPPLVHNRASISRVVQEALCAESWLDGVRLLRTAGIGMQVVDGVPMLSAGGHILAFTEVCDMEDLVWAFDDWEDLKVDFEAPNLLVDALAVRLAWMEATHFTWDIPGAVRFLPKYIEQIGLREVIDAVHITFRKQGLKRNEFVCYFRGVCKRKFEAKKFEATCSSLPPLPPLPPVMWQPQPVQQAGVRYDGGMFTTAGVPTAGRS